MHGYYTERLSGKRLQRCYEVASGRVRRYLEAEILFTVDHLHSTDEVLELGCGYGRVARRLAHVARHVVGIDTASESLDLARHLSSVGDGCEYILMDAVDLHFPDCSFDAVVCVQNGICAFGVDQIRLLKEALRVTRTGGIVLLSSYSDRFWPERLAWFEDQAREGLVGPVDHNLSCDGVIVCKDDLRIGRMTAEDFQDLCSRISVNVQVTEVDGSSVFCKIVKSDPT